MVAGDIVNTAARLQAVALPAPCSSARPPGTRPVAGSPSRRPASSAQGQGGAGPRVAGAAGRGRASAARAAPRRSRRRSWAATTSCACSRTCSTRRRASAASASCRSSARRASARAGSPGSSRSTSTVSSSTCAGTGAGHRPTARASPSGHSARWSGAGRPRRGRRAPTTRGRRGDGRRVSSPTRPSAAGSSPGCSRCSASARCQRAGARSCSRPGARSSSGSPTGHRRARVRGHPLGGRRPDRLHRAPPRLAARNQPIFVVTLARPELLERRPAWGPDRRTSSRLAWTRSPTTRCASCWRALCRDSRTRARDPVLARADGIPLYAVETIRMLVGDGRLEPADGGLRACRRPRRPRRARDPPLAVAARLDGLTPEARSLAQVASVLGQSFTEAALAAVSGTAARRWAASCARCVERELLALEPTRDRRQRASTGSSSRWSARSPTARSPGASGGVPTWRRPGTSSRSVMRSWPVSWPRTTSTRSGRHPRDPRARRSPRRPGFAPRGGGPGRVARLDAPGRGLAPGRTPGHVRRHRPGAPPVTTGVHRAARCDRRVRRLDAGASGGGVGRGRGQAREAQRASRRS